MMQEIKAAETDAGAEDLDCALSAPFLTVLCPFMVLMGNLLCADRLTIDFLGLHSRIKVPRGFEALLVTNPHLLITPA